MSDKDIEEVFEEDHVRIVHDRLQARICVARLLGLRSDTVWTEEGWAKVYNQAQAKIAGGED